MKFLRHVGKHGDRKVAVVFREVPGESHMCLVTYTELLNQNVHDPLIQCIDSDIGQSSENLADALNRSYTKDGRSILQVLHAEGQLKKVQTAHVVMTPNPTTKIKLEELNSILNEMKTGEEAVKRLAEMDKSLGLQDPKDVVKRMRGPQQQHIQSTDNGLLNDESLAKQRYEQAIKMEREANGLLAESQRLKDEAAKLGFKLETPKVESKETKVPKAKKTRAKVEI